MLRRGISPCYNWDMPVKIVQHESNWRRVVEEEWPDAKFVGDDAASGAIFAVLPDGNEVGVFNTRLSHGTVRRP